MTITKGIEVSTNSQPPTATKSALVQYSQYVLLMCTLAKKYFIYTKTYSAHICIKLAITLLSLLGRASYH